MEDAKKMLSDFVIVSNYPRKCGENLDCKMNYFPKIKSSRKNRNKGWILPILGVSFLTLALLMVLTDPLEKLVRLGFEFGPGTFVFELWKDPPVKVSLNFYVFNYTNSEAFLRGDEKLAMEEIGPYSYQEITGYRNITFHKNNTMSYIPFRTATDDLENTVGDPMTDIIVVPNFAFLGLSSYLSESSFLTNMAFNVFSRMVKSEPFLTMTVDQYLKGYDEPLLKYANKLVPGMVTFGKMGYLDRILSEGENFATIRLNNEHEVLPDGDSYEPFSIDTFNGDYGLREWGYQPDDNATHKICNTLHGLGTEGMLIPRRINESSVILLYRKAFCRILPVVYDRPGRSTYGVPAYWLKFPDNIFHNSNPDNTCYCDQEEEDCLPEGLTDIGACLFDMPVALSAPHFLFADPKLLEPWTNLRPNFEDHGSTGLVDNNFGTIIHAHLRMQLNLIVKKTKYNALVQPFNDMVLPAVWIEYKFNHLTPFYHAVLFVAAVLVPILNHVIIAVAILSGLFMVLRSVVRFLDARTEYKRLHRASTRTNTTEVRDLKTDHT